MAPTSHRPRSIRAAAVVAAAAALSGCQAHFPNFADFEFWLRDSVAQVEGKALPAEVSEPVRYATVQAQPDAAPTPAVVEVPIYVPAPRNFFDVAEERQAGAKRVADQRKSGNQVHDPKRAVRTPDEGRFMNAALVQPFIESMIYQVTVQIGRITTIRLEPGELVTSLEASDSSTIQLANSQVGSGSQLSQVIVLKPSDSFHTNNLQIVTNRRLYLLDLVMTDPGSEAYHRLVNWSYTTIRLPLPSFATAPAAGAPGHYTPARPPATPAAPVTAGYQPDMTQIASAGGMATPRAARLWELNFGYVVEGPAVPWKPLNVYDDGAKTVIRFPPEMLARKAPALFVIDLEDQVEAVNYRVRDNSYIVDGLFDRAALQLGQDRKNVVTIARTGIWNDPSSGRATQPAPSPQGTP